MRISFRGALAFAAFLLCVIFAAVFPASAQTFGNIQGTVTDPSNAVIPGATVEIRNPVSAIKHRHMAVTMTRNRLNYRHITRTVVIVRVGM